MSSSSVQVTRVVTLPAGEEGIPPLVSCVAVDQDGCLYLADELNHRVLGFDPGGSVLWSTGARGSGSCQFRYPRGLCNGWIEKSGSRVRCVAVADSWNERVCFLDLAGNPLHEWQAHGNDPFGQIIDLRYVPPDQGELEGTWLLLDRTRHRLLALTESGVPVFSAGRELPPFVKGDWELRALSIWSVLREREALPILPPRDYLYYPYRLLGKHPESLMIWEPLARTLKVCLWGCFLPITKVIPDALEWITADSSLILGWEVDPGVLYCFGVDGAERDRWPVHGRPVPSDVDPPYCWIQVDSELQRIRAPLSEGRGGRTSLLAPALLTLSAAKAAEATDLTSAAETVAHLAQCIDELGELAQVTDDALSSGISAQDRKGQKPRIDALEAEFGRLQGKLADGLQPLCSPAVDWKYAAVAAGDMTDAIQDEPAKLVAGLLQPLQSRFRPLVLTKDRLRVSLVRSQMSLPAVPSCMPETLDAAWMAFGALVRTTEWLYCRLGHGDAEILQAWRPVQWKDGFPREDWPRELNCTTTPPPRLPRMSLKECRRISVEGRLAGANVQPIHLCRAPNGRLLVSLFSGHEVQLIDRSGNVVLRLGQAGSDVGRLLEPMAVLYDRQDRIWVSEVGNRRVQMWSPPYDSESSTMIYGLPDTVLERPVGLFQLGTGDVLVADPLRNRILKIGPDGGLGVWLDRAGAEPGELSGPLTFCEVPSDPDTSLWLVDRANHRLQRLDAAGRCQRVVGGCSLARDSLLDPRAAGCFSDGTFVIAEDRDPAFLVLMTAGGSLVSRVPLDYRPGALIVDGEELFVPDPAGDCIRVYGRR